MAQKAGRLEQGSDIAMVDPGCNTGQPGRASPSLPWLSLISKHVLSDGPDTSWLPPPRWQKRAVILLSLKNFKLCLTMLDNHT